MHTVRNYPSRSCLLAGETRFLGKKEKEEKGEGMRIAGLARRESGWIILLFFFSRGARGRVEILLEGRVVVGKCSSVFPTGSKNFTNLKLSSIVKLDSSNLGKYEKSCRSKWKQNRSSIRRDDSQELLSNLSCLPVENSRDRIARSALEISFLFYYLS